MAIGDALCGVWPWNSTTVRTGVVGPALNSPTCGDTKTIRAYHCDKCGEYYPMTSSEQPPCPKCGAEPKPPA